MRRIRVTNVPPALRQALKRQAKANHRSLSAEVVALLAERIRTRVELARRKAFYERALEIAAQNGGVNLRAFYGARASDLHVLASTYRSSERTAC